MMYDDRLTNPELLQFSMQHFELVFDTNNRWCVNIIFMIILEKPFTFDWYSYLSMLYELKNIIIAV